MTPSEIDTLARDLAWWLTTSQVTPSQSYQALNIAYKQLHSIFTQADSNYWRERYTFTTVADQFEYTINDIDDVTPDWWQFKIEAIGLKYTTNDDYYKKLRKEQRDNLSYSYDRYAANQSTGDPFYIITDQSFMVFPTPETGIALWWLLEAIRKPYTLTSSLAETDISIDPYWHEHIAYAMVHILHRFNQDLDKARLAKQERDNEIKPQLVADIAMRSTTPVFWQMTDLSSLE